MKHGIEIIIQEQERDRGTEKNQIQERTQGIDVVEKIQSTEDVLIGEIAEQDIKKVEMAKTKIVRGSMTEEQRRKTRDDTSEVDRHFTSARKVG